MFNVIDFLIGFGSGALCVFMVVVSVAIKCGYIKLISPTGEYRGQVLKKRKLPNDKLL